MHNKQITINRAVDKQTHSSHKELSAECNMPTDDWKADASSSDIYSLFARFNQRFFWSRLGGVGLEWSKRMTRCAGKCYYRPRENYCCIRLSSPLLSLRPHSDLVDTLLHEMIHAYLFVTKTRDLDSHGAKFHEHMYRINKEAGTSITVYHTFHSEVKSYKQHWWRCDGPCQKRSPFFGMVKRATNRAPGPYDTWWRSHSFKCGGRFIKIREPLEYTRKRTKGMSSWEKFGITGGIKPSSVVFTPDGKNSRISYFPGRYELENKFDFAALTSTGFYNNLLARLPVNLRSKNSSKQEDAIDLSVGSRSYNCAADIGKCPVCDERVFKGRLKEHLEICNGLQGIFDDNRGLDFDDDSLDSDGSCSKKDHQQCPICALNINVDLSSHICKCLEDCGIINTFQEPSSTSFGNIKTDGHNVDSSSEKICKPITNSCPICSLELKGDVNSHLADGCLSNAGIIDDLDIALSRNECGVSTTTGGVRTELSQSISIDCGVNNIEEHERLANKMSCQVFQSDIKGCTKTHLARCLNQSALFKEPTTEISFRDPLVKICANEVSNRTPMTPDLLYVECDVLVFCRKCKKFYSLSSCPACHK